MKPKRLLLFLIIFLLGIAFERLVLSPKVISKEASDASSAAVNERADQQVTKPPAPIQVEMPSQRPVKKFIAPSAPLDTASRQASGDYAVPNLRVELEDNTLLEMAKSDFSEGKNPLRIEKPDGSMNTREKLSAGAFLDRAYDARGKLTGESLKLATGEELARAFYEDGSVRGVSVIKSDGSVTSATFQQSGYPKGRLDKLPDGTEISTDYDDRGQIVDRWKKSKEGKTEKL